MECDEGLSKNGLAFASAASDCTQRHANRGGADTTGLAALHAPDHDHARKSGAGPGASPGNGGACPSTMHACLLRVHARILPCMP